ncbi:hypothetical protein B0J12DRAFT_773977 [Macrophomina phaseolina]|uniref:AWS domain-containing protein n=1 Tax=Macrophomina phaseolina TaxID=35725 RepID=A0ABQ8FUX4_9PEZI|nr:hypothetical protein B0J12DRAFT_773977 [Macrophomina phaseolina]
MMKSLLHLRLRLRILRRVATVQGQDEASIIQSLDLTEEDAAQATASDTECMPVLPDDPEFTDVLERTRHQLDGWEVPPPVGDAFWEPVLPYKASLDDAIKDCSRGGQSSLVDYASSSSGKGKARADVPGPSQPPERTPNAMHQHHDVADGPQRPKILPKGVLTRPLCGDGFVEFPPPYNVSQAQTAAAGRAENEAQHHKGLTDIPSPSHTSPPTPNEPERTSHGYTTETTPADALPGPVNASAGESDGDSLPELSNIASRKRKRTATPSGRHGTAFDRSGHDQAIRFARQKAREHMVRRFNTSLMPVEYQVGDVVSGTIPTPYRVGKAGVLIGIVHEVVQQPEGARMYRMRTPYGVVDRTFAAKELELLHKSMRPDGLNEPQANTTVSMHAASYQNALTLGIADPSCRCKLGCHNNRCKCREALAKCTRECHNGASCSNSCEGESSTQGAIQERPSRGRGSRGSRGSRDCRGGSATTRGGAITRAGRAVRPTRRSLNEE